MKRSQGDTVDPADLDLRPSILRPTYWYGDRPPRQQWRRIRQAVIERDEGRCTACGHSALKWMHVHHNALPVGETLDHLVTLCVACHAVLHIGRNLGLGTIEIWKCDYFTQVDIVRLTRGGVSEGYSLPEIKEALPLDVGKYPPKSIRYANDLVRTLGAGARASLPRPYCAIFVSFKQWQTS